MWLFAGFNSLDYFRPRSKTIQTLSFSLSETQSAKQQDFTNDFFPGLDSFVVQKVMNNNIENLLLAERASVETII